MSDETAGFGPVRAVEAERDEAVRENVNAWREVAIVTARAESAEAALAGLREGIEALIRANERSTPGNGSAVDAGIDAADRAWRYDLRALLAPTPDREEARDE